MYKLENEKDEEIVNKILSKLNIQYNCHKYFTDGACSRVILLNNYYLIKTSTPNLLKAETEFLNLNKSDIMQKVIYIDDNYEFVVYEYIEGNVIKKVNDAHKIVKKLKLVIDNYVVYTKPGYGYLYEEVDTWKEFLIKEVDDSKDNIGDFIDINEIYKSIDKIDKYTFDKKLLHGDFGTHNLIELNDELVGIIDPQTVIGDPIYDLLFLIASNVSILNNIQIDEIFEIINEPKEKILHMFNIVIYCRIHRCIKYHKQDLEIYLDKFKEIKKILERGEYNG